MDPVTTATAIRATAAIASSLLRGIASFFGGPDPIQPYKFYNLGSFVERYNAGKLASVSIRDRDHKWTTGIKVPTYAVLNDANVLEARRTLDARSKISALAPSLLEGKKISFLRYFDKDPPSNPQHWEWLELGRAEYRDRWLPKARAILGEDPTAFMQKRIASQMAYERWAQMLAAGNLQGYTPKEYGESKALAEFYSKKHVAAMPRLQKAWKETPVANGLGSLEAAKSELGRWIATREVDKKKAVAGAMWFGPPVPWALEMAASAYGQFGASAVLGYASVSPNVTRDLRILLQRASPAAISDPVLAPFFGSS